MSPMTAAATLAPADLQQLDHTVLLARAARQRGDQPFGSVVVTKEGTMMEAMNSVMTRSDPTGHAEMNLVRAASAVLSSHTLSTATLYTSTEPCAMCAGAIYWSGIGRVVYALGQDDLARHVHAGTGGSKLTLSCREVLARGDRGIEVIGPVGIVGAADVHEGFWHSLLV